MTKERALLMCGCPATWPRANSLAGKQRESGREDQIWLPQRWVLPRPQRKQKRTRQEEPAGHQAGGGASNNSRYDVGGNETEVPIPKQPTENKASPAAHSQGL